MYTSNLAEIPKNLIVMFTDIWPLRAPFKARPIGGDKYFVVIVFCEEAIHVHQIWLKSNKLDVLCLQTLGPEGRMNNVGDRKFVVIE
jgi:hypothetical protein